MGFPENTLRDEERIRVEIDISNFDSKEGVQLGEGAHNKALRSPHRYVMKDPDEDPEFLRQRKSELENIDRVPWSEVIVSDDRSLVRMAEADLTHEEAVEKYGFQQVIQEDFQMFVELAEEGVVYEDFKPANIGYFQDGKENSPEFESVRASPIDLYDCESLKIEDPSLIHFQPITDVYMTGNSDFSGLTGRYDLNEEEAHEMTIRAIAEDPEDIIGSRFYDVDDATREFYHNNLR